MGSFVSKSDVGFGTIVGSAVFNVLFVIGLCALVVPGGEVPLTWWPLFRDCSYYIVGLAVLAVLVKEGNSMNWYEAIILFLLYIGCVTTRRPWKWRGRSSRRARAAPTAPRRRAAATAATTTRTSGTTPGRCPTRSRPVCSGSSACR